MSYREKCEDCKYYDSNREKYEYHPEPECGYCRYFVVTVGRSCGSVAKDRVACSRYQSI